MTEIIGVVVGALLVGGFTITANHFAADRAHSQWLRTERGAAYSDFLRATDLVAVTFSTRRIAVRLKDPGSPDLSFEEVTEYMVGPLESASRIAILGPEAVYRAARKLTGTFDVLMKWSLNNDLDPGADTPQMAKAREARDNFVDAARAALRASR